MAFLQYCVAQNALEKLVEFAEDEAERYKHQQEVRRSGADGSQGTGQKHRVLEELHEELREL